MQMLLHEKSMSLVHIDHTRQPTYPLNMKPSNDKTNKDTQWINDIPLPLPGLYYIEPSLNIDFKTHDDSLETMLPPTIYTDPLDLIQVDFMKIVYDDICAETVEQDEKQGKVYKEEYDYEKYIKESFDDVYAYEHPIDKNIKVKSTYDVFPGLNSKYVVLQSEGLELSSDTYSVKENEHSKLYQYLVDEEGNNTYEGTRYSNNDYVICKIKDGKVYYYDTESVFKYRKNTKK